MYDKYDECYARSWAKPGSIYILVVRQSMRTCHAGCAAYPYFLTCLGLVRPCSSSIEAHIVVRGFPPYNIIIKTLWKMLLFHDLIRHDKHQISSFIDVINS